MERTLPVKRVSVSIAVEIPSRTIDLLPVSPPHPDKLSTCKKCQRERTRTRDYKHKPKPVRRKQARANTPIVIQLKDTLKAAIRQRCSKLALLQKQESEKDDADVETDNSSDPSCTDATYTDRSDTDRSNTDHSYIDRGGIDQNYTDRSYTESYTDRKYTHHSYRARSYKHSNYTDLGYTDRNDAGYTHHSCTDNRYTDPGITDHFHEDQGCTETDRNYTGNCLSEIEQKQRRNNDKNLSAFLNVMEKAHKKENICDTNLTDSTTHEKLVADFVLNNVSNTQATPKACSKKSIVECDNVEVICNDLTSVESTRDESEESEIASTTSSSEILSDADIYTSQDSAGSQELTGDELQRLAEYTTGCPLIRYDCPPAECPQCRSAYNAQHNQTEIKPHSTYSDKSSHYPSSNYESGHKHATTTAHSSYSTVPSSSHDHAINDRDVADTDLPSDTTPTGTHIADTNTPLSKTHHYSGSNRPPLRKQQSFDITRKQGKCIYNSHNEPFLGSVYVDLTDTDVSFTVYYHHNFENQPLLTSTLSTSYAARATIGSIMSTHHHQGQFLPYMPIPVYPQYMYWPGYCAPVCNLAPSFYLPAEEYMPKTAMIPPEELPKFSASQPPARHWIPLARPEQGRPAAIFTVMCYNVLCDKYCTQQMYGYCPSWALNWEYRKKGIMDEIKNCSADLICLQEIETDQFYNFFLPELEREGYTGIFSPKSRARTMTEQERKHVDGCAIFYRKTKFRLVKEHLIEFNQLAMANAEGSDEMLNRVMTKDNIGLAALLETQEGVFDSGGGLPPDGKVKQPLLVTTAHMHWDPEYSDVKLIQTMMLMSELKRILEESYHTYRMNVPTSFTPDCNAIPMILCGDLNSLPESGVIEYLSTGKVAGNHCDFKELGYEACLQTFNCSKDTTQLTHNFHLGRAYLNDSMPNTNYTFDFKGIIDYIFYSKTHMNLLGLLGPLDENWFTENKVAGCPHPHVPSDHFSLFVEFEMPVPYPEHGGSATSRENAASSNALAKLR